jgi:hypothetical protein
MTIYRPQTHAQDSTRATGEVVTKAHHALGFRIYPLFIAEDFEQNAGLQRTEQKNRQALKYCEV